ncbi:DMT family transporter [Bacillus sp. SM2101]|uniref:DMT family transporter n=1 Tax=Bacillus sp. SM2101 TaxID=2805366 RepID=UPI001BDDCD09|nr:DMT family transporter [Bacillus sp. SM2101]
MNDKPALPILAGVIGAVLGGLSFLFLKNVVSMTTPLNILSIRFTIAFLVIALLVLSNAVKIQYYNKPILPLILFSTIHPVLAFLLQTYGMKYTTSSEAGVITALVPIIVMILASVLLKERTNITQKTSILLSVGGVTYITLMKGLETDGNLVGITLIVLSALSMALYTVLIREIAKQFTAMEITFAMMGIGMVIFNILLFLSPERVDYSMLLNTSFLFSILYLAIISSLLGAMLKNYAYARMKASQAGVFMNLATIVSIIAGVFILNEPFYSYHLIGSMLIILGVVGVHLQRVNLKRFFKNKKKTKEK